MWYKASAFACLLEGKTKQWAENGYLAELMIFSWER